MEKTRHYRLQGLAVVALGVLAQAVALAEGPPPVVGHVERLDPRLDALIAPGAVVEKVADGNVWTEGPLWDGEDGSVLYVAANHWILRIRTLTKGKGL
jgi:gluconolactonase